MEIYPAKYSDKNGELETTIRNNWSILRMNLRGIEFSGSSFDYFRPGKKVAEENLQDFSISVNNELSDFRLECKIPVRILENDKESRVILEVNFNHKTIELSTGFYDYELILTLSYLGQEFRSTLCGDFEECFGEIDNQTRKSQKNFQLKCCFGCRLSDYSVYGHDTFGSLICFKNHKEKFLNMKNQYDYYDLLEEKNLNYVQEIYLCDEFQTRNLQANNLS